MHPMLRSIIAIIVGAICCAIVISLVEMISSAMYPKPEGMDLNDMEALKKFVATLPPPAFVLVLAAWAIGGVTGGFVSAKIAGRAPMIHAGIACLPFFGASIAMIVMLPHPTWFWIPGVLAVPIGALFGASLVKPKRGPAVSPTSG